MSVLGKAKQRRLEACLGALTQIQRAQAPAGAGGFASPQLKLNRGGVMKKSLKTLLVSLGLPLSAGALAAWPAWGGAARYGALNLPLAAPPAWVFPLAGAGLYLLLGLSAWLIRKVSSPFRRAGLTLYLVQLALSLAWPLLFFRLGAYLPALLLLLLLLLLAGGMTVLFSQASQAAAWLQLPYLLSLMFLAWLNLMAWLLNPALAAWRPLA